MTTPEKKSDKSETETGTPYYKLDVQDVLNAMSTDSGGLTSEDVRKRQLIYGKNTLQGKKTDTLLTIFIRQFKSPLIYLLIVAAIVVFALGEYIDGSIIVAVLLFNATVGTFQSYKAQNTLQALKKFAKTYAIALRDGERLVIEDEELVPGDIINLKEGDKVPADARVISCHNLHVKESALTGESEPISKNEDAVQRMDIPLGDRRNMVYRGTSIVSGNATAVVIGTGTKTEIGRISEQVEDIDREIPLQKNIRRLSNVIVYIVLLLAGFVFTFGILTGQEFEYIFTLGISIIVSAIPEGLPIVITLVLATGVWRMSKRKVLVKQLQAVEALGEADVLAVDKTGTLTENVIVVKEIYSHGKHYTVEGSGYSTKGAIREGELDIENPKDEPFLNRAALIGALSSSAIISENLEKDGFTVNGDPTEAALTALAKKAGIPEKAELLDQHPLLDEIPFTSETKYHAMLHRMDSGERMSILIGAPEIVLEKCSQYFFGEDIKEIDGTVRTEILKTIKELSSNGYRVLAFSKRTMDKDSLEESDIGGFVYEGLYAMRDSLRSNVIDSIKKIQGAGIRVMMITGDHKVTARAIARNAGIYKDGDSVIEGQEIDALSDEDLAERIKNVSVFARVSPNHKLRIVTACQTAGKTIAMTGDGVNDALSLVSADLGVSMGKQGTEVAKEASDLVLMDDNISSITAAIEEGRAIYQNIKKVILFLFTTSTGEITIILVALLTGLPVPITAAQLIWLNFITDGFLDAALAMEPKEKGLLRRSFPKPSKWIVEGHMVQRMLIKAGTMVVGSLGMFLFALSQQESLPYAITIAVTTMAAFQWTKIWTCRSDYHSVFSRKMRMNKYLLGATTLVIILHVMAIYNPHLSNLLGFEPISLFYWTYIIPVALSVILVDEIWKVGRRADERDKKTQEKF